MENVKGFDESTARDSFVSMLQSFNYSYQVIFIFRAFNFLEKPPASCFFKEFLLSPIQFGIPNTRLRYFLIAKLNCAKKHVETQTQICE